jgi:hypothetical protein
MVCLVSARVLAGGCFEILGLEIRGSRTYAAYLVLQKSVKSKSGGVMRKNFLIVLLGWLIVMSIGILTTFYMAERKGTYYIDTPIMNHVRTTINSYSWLPFWEGVGCTVIFLGFSGAFIVVAQELRYHKKRVVKKQAHEEKLRAVK